MRIQVHVDLTQVEQTVQHVTDHLPTLLRGATEKAASAILQTARARLDHEFQEFPSYLLWHHFKQADDGIRARAYPPGTLATFARRNAGGYAAQFGLPDLSADALAIHALEAGVTGSSFAGGGSRGRPGSATRAAFEKDLNVARQIASGVLPVQRGPRGANSIRTLLTMAVTQPRKGAVSAAVGYPAGIGHRGRYRYISWVLFGTKRMVPRNFLRDAFKAHIQTYMTAIKEAYYASFPGMGPVGVAVGEHQAAEAAAEKAAAKRARALPIPEEALGFFMGQRTLEGATDPFELLSARQEAAQRARQFDSEALRPYIEVDSKED